MDSSKNQASLIVEGGYQAFQYYRNNHQSFQEKLEYAQKWRKRIFRLLLVILGIGLVCLFMRLTQSPPKNNTRIETSIIVLLFGLAIASLYCVRLELSYRAVLKIVRNGAVRFIQERISQTIIYNCLSRLDEEDDYSSMVCCQLMEKIINDFFSPDFSSPLTAAEENELKQWVQANWTSCLRAS